MRGQGFKVVPGSDSKLTKRSEVVRAFQEISVAPSTEKSPKYSSYVLLAPSILGNLNAPPCTTRFVLNIDRYIRAESNSFRPEVPF